MNEEYKRGEVVLVDLEPVKGSEQGKTRLCIIVQNNIANKFSPVTNIVPITDAKKVAKWYPCLVFLDKGEGGIIKDSAVQCNQIRTVDIEERIIKKIGHINNDKIEKINDALKIQLDLN